MTDGDPWSAKQHYIGTFVHPAVTCFSIWENDLINVRIAKIKFKIILCNLQNVLYLIACLFLVLEMNFLRELNITTCDKVGWDLTEMYLLKSEVI